MNDKILEEILENTQAVRSAVVKVPKDKEKRQEALSKAQAKFKKVGTNLKEEDAEIVNKRCEELGVNQSQYIKRLIESDLKPSEATEEINEGNELPEAQKEPESDLNELQILRDNLQIEKLKSERLEKLNHAQALAIQSLRNQTVWKCLTSRWSKRKKDA